MRIAPRLFTLALLVGALTLAVNQTTGVRADNFTDVGCPSGNYSCLITNGGQLPPQNGYPYYGYYGQGPSSPFAAVGCADNDYNCYYARMGVSYAPPVANNNPFAAVGCANYDYGCLYNSGYGTGITVIPYAPNGQTPAPPAANTVFTSATTDTTQPGVVTALGR